MVTHSHPDHVGLAGWITERFCCPLQMSQVEYLQSVSPEPRHRRAQARAAAVLPPSRHGRNPHRKAARPRPGLSQARVGAAAGLPPHLAWRRNLDRDATLQGHHRRRPCARPGDAV
ncbi:hypothetical protein, partial [Acinetobacter baumannii]|uniref:hypothetical protein n=1 Tax=Acinetobacter baumannii TaxID=470 RepID=UPI003F661777